jgi:hypothetical protein
MNSPQKQVKSRYCGSCKQAKAWTIANFHGHGEKGLQTWCRDCMKAASKRQTARRKYPQKPAKKLPGQFDWRDLASSIPQPSKPIDKKLPF